MRHTAMSAAAILNDCDVHRPWPAFDRLHTDSVLRLNSEARVEGFTKPPGAQGLTVKFYYLALRTIAGE